MDGREAEMHRAVIVGGGFAGLYAAKVLAHAPARVTLVDRRNFHLFQPLLYQVATGNLAAGDIAAPLRAVVGRYPNVEVLLAEVIDLLPAERKVILSDGELAYDTLIVATGVRPYYFGHDDWAGRAPSLKTVEDAIAIRRRVLLAFEAAERETDPGRRQAWMTFVVVGGGSTGVELSGALGELAHHTLRRDFQNVDPTTARILLLEAADRILPPYPPELSARAGAALARLGVTVQTGSMVTRVSEHAITVQRGEQSQEIQAQTILWTAGVRTTPMAQVLAERTGAGLDRLGRVIVEPDLTIPGHPEIFVLGDLAHYAHQGGQPLPAVAPVAIQEGQYVARLVRARLRGGRLPAFRYRDRGNLAVIGRNAAVAQVRRLKFSGFIAWLLWVVIHIYYLIEFDQKMLVMFRWVWNYFTSKRGARLIMRTERETPA
jgi:NADH dehydrogenase